MAGASLDRGILVKLIIPDQVMKRAVVDLVKGGADGIGCGLAGAAVALFQGRGVAARENVLLAHPVFLNIAAKGTGPRRSAAIRKLPCVQFEDEPPVHWRSRRQQ